MLKGNQSKRIARPFYSNTKRELKEKLSRSPKRVNDEFIAVGESMHRVVQPKIMTPRLPVDQKSITNNMIPSVIKRRREKFVKDKNKLPGSEELE